MKKAKAISYIFGEMLLMIKEYKFYFLAPILIALAILAFVVYYVGPAVVVSFMYAGV